MKSDRERAYQTTMAAWNLLGECPCDKDIEDAVTIIQEYAVNEEATVIEAVIRKCARTGRIAQLENKLVDVEILKLV